MTNELQPGQSRIGYAWDTRIAEPYPAMLRDRDGRIELVIPFDSDADEAMARRYIGDMVTWGDDHDLSRFDYTLPEHFWFADAHGFVSLIGRSSRSVYPLMGTAPLSECRIAARFAVFTVGPSANFSVINGLRSRIEGLSLWLGHRSVTSNYLDRKRPGEPVTLTVQPPRSESIQRKLNLEIVAGSKWTMPGEPGVTSIDEVASVQTSVTRPRPWREHLDVHEAILELLQLASWRPLGFQSVRAMHSRDPQRVLSGDVVGDHWGKVNSYALPGPSERTARLDFAFTFEDIGVAGVRRWLRLRQSFRRGLRAMTFSISSPGTSLDGLISDAGIGLEELGHKIDLADGGGRRRPHEQHLLAIAREVEDVLPFAPDKWAADSATMYNDIKHADRSADRSAQDMQMMLQQNRQVFRLWAARRLGVTKTVLVQNMRHFERS